jgi:hypothetical protein
LSLLLSGCVSPVPRTYPIGLYSVPSDELENVSAAGVSVVAGTLTKSYLDRAQTAKVQVLGAPGTFAGPQFNAPAARSAVRAFDSHPALWGWYVIDEPDLNRIAPEEVVRAHRYLKSVGARKPTALALFQGSQAFYYAHLTDILMIDRYPIPWLPLANFPQHVRMSRLALGPEKPLIAIIQAFDWSYFAEHLPREKDLRLPTGAEMRCMAYCALAQRANGIFFYAFATGRWKIKDHPETWTALQGIIGEIRRREPLFQAQHQWWPYRHTFREYERRFNRALESSISIAWLKVARGSASVPAGNYALAVNTTPETLGYKFTFPQTATDKKGKQKRSLPAAVEVFEEHRKVEITEGWVEDEFGPYAIHVYGPW